MSEQPYDPYIPSGQTGGASRDGNQRTAALQAVRYPRNSTHTCAQRLTNPAGNRLDRQCHAQQHQQGLGARRAPRQSARQDRQPGRFGAGLQTWREQSQKADVVEGHEDENVPDHRHHPLARHHHRPQWYVNITFPASYNFPRLTRYSRRNKTSLERLVLDTF
jgi:hypothetical protein